MIMKVVPAHRNPIARPHDIALPIIRIRPHRRETPALKFIVINPHTRAIMNRNPVVARDAADTKVAHDDVGHGFDVKAAGEDICTGAGADEGLIGADGEAACEGEVAGQVDGAGG